MDKEIVMTLAPFLCDQSASSCINNQNGESAMDPFHKTVMTRLMVISIVNPQKCLNFFFFYVCTL